MPTSFFVLSRFSLRVDGVLFRLFDTRIYHSFASSPPLIVRETSGWEAPFHCVKSVRHKFTRGASQLGALKFSITYLISPFVMCLTRRAVPAIARLVTADGSLFCAPRTHFTPQVQNPGPKYSRWDRMARIGYKGRSAVPGRF